MNVNMGLEKEKQNFIAHPIQKAEMAVTDRKNGPSEGPKKANVWQSWGQAGGRPKLHWLKETYVPWGVTVEETYSGQRGMEKAVGRGHGSSWTGAPVL